MVADEVRKLAERTTKATEEISGMIEAVQRSAQVAVAAMGASVAEVNDGVSLAKQAGETIVRIKDDATHVVDVVNNIAASLDEQCAANDSLSDQVETVAQMTETNAQATVNTAAEAEKLKELAGHMQKTMGQFKI